MNAIPLRCACGIVQGELDAQPTSGRARCYCKDCQAYARFLGRQSEILDVHGGTDLIATLPAAVRFTAGLEQLACMTLTDKGPLRWYTACCRTPIGNTARDHKIAYVGVVSSCLALPSASLDNVVGPANIALNTTSAQGSVASTPGATFLGVLKIMGNAVKARLNGRYKINPFFDAASGKAIRPPQHLDGAQKQAIYRDPA